MVKEFLFTKCELTKDLFKQCSTKTMGTKVLIMFGKLCNCRKNSHVLAKSSQFLNRFVQRLIIFVFVFLRK